MAAPQPNPRVERAQQQTVPPTANAQPQLTVDPVFFAQLEKLLSQLPPGVDPAAALASLYADLFGPKQTQTLAQPTSPKPEAEIVAGLPPNVEEAGTQSIIEATDSLSEEEVGAPGLGGLLASYSSSIVPSAESEKMEIGEEVEQAVKVTDQGQDLEPSVSEKEPAVENDPPIVREDIEVVEIDDDVDEDVD